MIKLQIQYVLFRTLNILKLSSNIHLVEDILRKLMSIEQMTIFLFMPQEHPFYIIKEKKLFCQFLP